jgi:hypothetical protein
MESTRAINSGNNYESYEMRGKRWRVAPRPGGFYLAYLDELIERNRAKRGGDNVTSVSDEDAKEEAYWRERERWHQEQQTRKAA